MQRVCIIMVKYVQYMREEIKFKSWLFKTSFWENIKNAFNLKLISLRKKRDKDVRKVFKIGGVKKLDYFPKDGIVTDFLISEYTRRSVVSIINNLMFY